MYVAYPVECSGSFGAIGMSGVKEGLADNIWWVVAYLWVVRFKFGGIEHGCHRSCPKAHTYAPVVVHHGARRSRL